MLQAPKGEIIFVTVDGSFEQGHGTWAWVAFGASMEQLGYAYGHREPQAGLSANVMEYWALNQALRYLKEHTVVHKVTIRSDSQLMVRQMTGEYQCRAESLVPLYQEAKKWCMSLNVRFEWIRRERNMIADHFTFLAYPMDIQEAITREGFSYERGNRYRPR